MSYDDKSWGWTTLIGKRVGDRYFGRLFTLEEVIEDINNDSFTDQFELSSSPKIVRLNGDIVTQVFSIKDANRIIKLNEI